MPKTRPNPELTDHLTPTEALREMELLVSRRDLLQARIDMLMPDVLAAGVGTTVEGTLSKVTVAQPTLPPDVNLDLLKTSVARRIFNKVTIPVLSVSAWRSAVEVGLIPVDVVETVTSEPRKGQPYLVWSALK